MWIQPTAMDWTIIPATVTAKAWTDPVFKADFLLNPSTVLRSISKRWPYDINFIAHEDVGSDRNLTLPVTKPILASMSNTELMTLLNTEIGGDDTLEWMLPADVIFKAMTDPTYRSNLLSAPTATLAADGYAVGSSNFIVHENTATDYHLTLAGNPLNSLDLSMDNYRARLYSMFAGGTTKCCATGTDDCEKEPLT